jgi:hypothetical protein
VKPPHPSLSPRGEGKGEGAFFVWENKIVIYDLFLVLSQNFIYIFKEVKSNYSQASYR